jgi:thioredoxin-related protein
MLPALVVVLALGSVSEAIGEGWADNFEKAKAQAAAEGKDLLVDFTGSDWCGWCIRLSKEVFTKDVFKTEAPKSFVLVALDFPRDKSLVSEKTAKQNAELKVKYPIPGYPTIYLMDAKGRPYAKTGYQSGGAEKYLAHLAELKAKRLVRDKNLAAAKDAENDLAKARSIDKALEAMGTEIAGQFYTAEMKQIIALDSDNEAGLKSKYERIAFDRKVANLLRQRKYDEAIALMEEHIKTEDPKGKELADMRLSIAGAYRGKRDLDKALEIVDSVLEKSDLQGEALQQALSTKAQIYQSKRDMENMKKVLAEAIKAAPETPMGKSMQAYLDRMKRTDKK